MRQKPTLENIFKIPNYRNIINLLIKYQHHKGGLTFEHLRVVLVKGYDYQNMFKFFGEDDLDNLVKSGNIHPNSISSKNNLNHCLNVLNELGIISIIKGNKNIKGGSYLKKTRYKIQNQIVNLAIQQQNILDIQETPYSFTFNRNLKGSIHVIYNYNERMFESLMSHDKNKLIKCMNNIEDNIREIERTRFRNLIKLTIFKHRLNSKCERLFGSDECIFIILPWIFENYIDADIHNMPPIFNPKENILNLTHNEVKTIVNSIRLGEEALNELEISADDFMMFFNDVIFEYQYSQVVCRMTYSRYLEERGIGEDITKYLAGGKLIPKDYKSYSDQLKDKGMELEKELKQLGIKRW